MSRVLEDDEDAYRGIEWGAVDKIALAEAELAAGLRPGIMAPPAANTPVQLPLKPTYDGDLNPDEIDALTPFLVKEMKTRGKVSAIDCLNSLIWLKRHNCYWTRTPVDRYGGLDHRRKLIERWAREGRFDRLAVWIETTTLSDKRKAELLSICNAQTSRGRRLRALLLNPRG